MSDSPPKPVSGRRFLLGLAAGAAFWICVLAVAAVLYENEWRARGVAVERPVTAADRVDVQARLQSVDPAAGTAAVRFQLTPRGRFDAPGSAGSSVDLRLFTTATDRPVVDFPAGAVLAPVEGRLDLDGLVSDYPFDVHLGLLGVEIVEDPRGPAPRRVPVALTFEGWLPGFGTEAIVEPDTGDQAVLEVRFTRPSTTLYFAALVSLLMWTLSLAALTQAILLIAGRRRIEPTMFGYMAALMFSFPALRNAMPGAPSIGAIIDYAAFFWAEAIAGAALLLGLLSWLLRPYR